MPITDFDRYFSDAAIECDEVGPADSGATTITESTSPTTITATFGTDYAGNQPTLNRVKWILAIYSPQSSISIGTKAMTLYDGTNTQNIGTFPAAGVATNEEVLQGEATVTGLTALTNIVSVIAIITTTVGGTATGRLRALGNE